MIGRVTHQTIQRSTLGNLQVNLTAMADLQAKMSGGKKITTPSDDPAGTSDSLRLRAEKRAAEQYSRNADDGDAWLTTVDSSLQTSITALRRARDLAIQGTNGAMGPASREALAVEIEGVRDSLVERANATYLGRNVFAGTSDAGYAFSGPTGTPPYTFTGTPGASVDRRISAQTTVRVDADGTTVFGEGPTSVFAVLDQLAATLRTPGADSSTHLNAIDTHMESMLTQLSAVGARQSRVMTAQTELQSTQQGLKTQLGAVEDLDLAEIILELQMQEVSYQGALGAASKVLQPSLLDFLR
jgi:flagellar hook-associated protein 3 FlgL